MRRMNMGANLRRLFGRIESADHRRRRMLNLVQSVVTNLGNRLVMLAITFMSVPLTIGYLGPERYGAWVTIGSVLAWLSLTDFGLGNGLTNAVTTAAGQERPDLARMHLSNGVFMMSAIAGGTGLIAAAAWPFIDWSALFGVTSEAAKAEVGPAIAAALAIFLLQFPLSMAGKVYLAYQEGRIGSYLGMAGNVLSFAALLVVTQTHGGLVWLVTAVSGTSMLVNLAGNLWMFLLHRPCLRPGLRHVDPAQMRSLGRVGGKFFLIQITALVTFQTDNLVIAHYLGSGHVPQYSLTYSLFSYVSLPQSILFTYLWVAYTEAIARKDIAWVSRIFHLNLVLGTASTAAGVAVLAFIARPFIGWWAGPAVIPSFTLVAWMAAWSVINAFTSPIACLLAAASHLRTQIILSAASSVSNVFLSIVLIQRWGIDGVIAATVISYALFLCGPLYVDVEALLQRLRHAAEEGGAPLEHALRTTLAEGA